MRRLLPCLFLLAIVLSGCTDAAAPTTTSQPATAAPPEPKTDTGSVTGRVLTEDLLPIARARVILMPNAISTETAEGGEFTFNDVEPGKYNLLGESLGYMASGSRIEVMAGQVTYRNITLKAIELDQEPFIRSHPGSVYLTFGASDFHRLAQTRGYSCSPCEVWIHIVPTPADALFEPEWTRTLSVPRIAESHSFYVKAKPSNGTIIATGTDVWSKKMVSREQALFSPEQVDRLEGVNSTMVHVNTNPTETVSLMQRVNFWFTLSYHAKLPEGYTALPN